MAARYPPPVSVGAVRIRIGYGTEGPDWISTFGGIGPDREVHVAFSAADAATVRAWHAEAPAAGAEWLHEPGCGLSTPPAHYGAFVRDTEGNIEAVCHTGDS